jgi:hypothetical protein
MNQSPTTAHPTTVRSSTPGDRKQEHKLSEDLRLLLTSQDGQQLTLGRLFDAMGDRGFGLVLMLLSLPSALPVPAPGYSTPFGIMLILLALQMMAGRHRPWMPLWAKKIRISEGLANTMLKGAAAFFTRIEHLIKPRWSWASGRGGHFFAGFIVLSMGLLMALPIPGTNTAPAGVIFLVGVALTEEDGLFMAAASALGAAVTALYGLILYVAFYLGAGGVSEAVRLMKTWLGI